MYADVKGRILKKGSDNNTKRLGKRGSKLVFATFSKEYRALMIRKMEARVKYLVVLEAFGHQPDALLEHMTLCAESYDEMAVANANFAPEVTDKWKRFLLLYSAYNLTTYINHQAVRAHTDSQGNETLTMFGVYNYRHASEAAMLEEAIPGETLLLEDRVGLRLNTA